MSNLDFTIQATAL